MKANFPARNLLSAQPAFGYLERMTKRKFLGLCLSALSLIGAEAGERVVSRSMVITKFGLAASEHPLASQAGVRILESGGNAVDAAIAMNAVMGVVSPMMCGMGGDLFALVYDQKTGRTYGLNASGWAPKGLTLEHVRSQGFTNMPQQGINSITLPGAVAGWQALQDRFASKKLKELLAPAIYYAREGFPVTELVASYWAAEVAKLQKDVNAAKTFLKNGEPYKTGEIFRNRDMAWSLQQVADDGAKAFYKGKIADRLLNYLNKQNGKWEKSDLAEFKAQWVAPITTEYHGWQVLEIPPNGQGIAALSMLNIMEGFPLRDWGHNSVSSLHHVIEAKKLAYADMFRYVADPSIAAIPVSQMLSKNHGQNRAKLIDAGKANCDVAASDFPGGTDTTYLCVVDKDGNMVSLIQSIYNAFGTGMVADGTGFALHNRGGLFSLDPESPNVLAPRKRPLHTIIPGMMERDGMRIAFGIMGGWNQAQAHAQFVSNLIDHKMNIQEALDAPRMTKLTFPGCDVSMESRVQEATRNDLQKLGHQIKVLAPFAQDVGGGQAVMRDYRTGVNYGGSDPRKDGAAIPEQPKLKGRN